MSTRTENATSGATQDAVREPDLCVVGTLAFDDVETPAGRRTGLRRPRPETTLMVAPYWNCDRHGGRVCQGSMRVPGSLCLAARQGWENAFFQSEFTHAAGDGRRADRKICAIRGWTLRCPESQYRIFVESQ